jgi:hypothetical protein
LISATRGALSHRESDAASTRERYHVGDHPDHHSDFAALGRTSWPHSRDWGYYPGGGIGLLLVIIIILVLVRAI